MDQGGATLGRMSLNILVRRATELIEAALVSGMAEGEHRIMRLRRDLPPSAPGNRGSRCCHWSVEPCGRGLIARARGLADSQDQGRCHDENQQRNPPFLPRKTSTGHPLSANEELFPGLGGLKPGRV